MRKTELKDVPLNKIYPYSDNPRITKKAVSKVADSLKTHGYLKTSIGVDENMVMLYGHTTLKAMELLKWRVVPEVSQFFDLPEHIKTTYRIADNKTGEYAEWDYEKLWSEVKRLATLDGFSGNYSELGMSPQELSALRKAHEGTTDRPVPEPLTTDIKPGDLIQLGRHRIICGDCTDTCTVTRLYDGEIASMIFTSPPYNVGNEGWLGSSESKYEGDDSSDMKEYLNLLRNFTEIHLSRCCYLFLNLQMVKGNKTALIEYLYHYRFNLADIIVWDKQTAQPAMADNILNSQFEFIFVLKDAPANRKTGTQKFRGTVSNVYSAPPNHENKYSSIHSASFPLHLPSFAIKNFTNPAEVVCDPFLGLGTTLLACEQLGRVCYGIEQSPLYCEAACQRWESLTMLKRNLL